MKKLIVVISLILVLLIGSIYTFIPSKIEILSASVVKCTSKSASACINDTSRWKLWWPTAEDYSYTLRTPYTDGAEILMYHGNKSYQTRLQTTVIGPDSSVVQWITNFPSGMNPLHRILQGYFALQIKRETTQVLEQLKKYVERTENIYGFNIRRTTFTDTLLAATEFSGKKYPSVNEIYQYIDSIRTSLLKLGIIETGYPMLNVNKKDSSHYETTIAIPVNKSFGRSKNIFVSRMVPMKDRFLFTEVLGGPVTIEKAHKAIYEYMDDHFLSAPAIPFEILISDRRKETDTSKWQTEIYQPSM